MIEVSTVGEKRIAEMLAFAPQRSGTVLRKRMYVERNRFVGSRKGKRLGSFTRTVMRRRRRGRPGTMPINVATMFRGFLRAPRGRTADMTLTMGVLSPNPKPFVRGILDLQRGFTRTSSSYMPLPVYNNLHRYGFTRAYTRHFHELLARDELIVFRSGSGILYMWEPAIEQGAEPYDAVLWIGRRQVSVRKMDFGFIRQWRTRLPGVMKRMQNALNREMRTISRGYGRRA